MTQAIGKVSTDLVAAMRRYVEEEAQGADRIMVSVPVRDVADQSRQQGQPAQMSAASAQQMELAVNPAAVLPFVQKLLPSLGHVAIAVLGGQYGGVLSILVRQAAPEIRDLLTDEQWAKLHELVEILDPRTLQAAAHPRVMSVVKS
jgi:uncharacterized alpha-E superfamily protein